MFLNVRPPEQYYSVKYKMYTLVAIFRFKVNKNLYRWSIVQNTHFFTKNIQLSNVIGSQ